MHESISRKTI